MKIAVFSLHLGFFDPLEAAFKKRGHEIRYWREASGYANGYNIAKLMQWCDVAFVEFCQTPLVELIAAKADYTNVFLVGRMHRIEIYNELTLDKKLDWGKMDLMFVSATHVVDRFLKTREGVSKPAEVIIASTNIADPSRFKLVNRKWQAPFRICLLGNFVPKKRQYTAIQYMYDVKEKFGTDFKLDIIGDRGKWTGYGNVEYFQNCQDLIEDLGLKDIVTIYDAVPHAEVPAMLAREHVILSNSNEEGTHVSIAEGAMTGCIPFVSQWRGAEAVYPPDVAWGFKSPGEFMKNCEKLKSLAADGQAAEASEKLARIASEKYGRIGLYEKMVEQIENAVAAKNVKVVEPVETPPKGTV